MKRVFITIIAVFWLGLVTGGTSIGGHGEVKPIKKGILVVVFGTSVPEAKRAFDQIDQQVKEAFPSTEIRWAYSSEIIRKKLAKQGEIIDSPVIALAKMTEDGFTHTLVASFHIIAGKEYHDLCVNSHLFEQMSGGMERVLVSRPLLDSRDDYERALRAKLKQIPQSNESERGVIMMGHGSEHHPSDAAYPALNFWAAGMDPNLFIATVEGQPTLDHFLPVLKARGIKKVYLTPFMSVAGDHARNDMCGADEASWASILKKKGFEVECELKGMARLPEVVDIWIDHMKAAFSHFE